MPALLTTALELGPTWPNPRAAHESTTLVLSNGRILVAGGLVPDPSLLLAAMADGTCDVFDPVTQAWTTSACTLQPSSFLSSVTELPGGDIVVAGGLSGRLATSPVATPPLPNVTRLDLAHGTCVTLTPMAAPRAMHAAIATADGMVVLVGVLGASGVATGNAIIESIRD